MPPEKFAANLRAMVALVRSRGMTPVLVTPPLSQKFQREYPVFALYRDSVREVATRDAVPLVPAAEDLAARERWGQALFMDPVHPNAEGHEIVAELAAQVVAPLVQKEAAGPAGLTAAARAR